ncbi:hypothetical protein K438DRAFT_1783875 [Mycena galopus ATCC 62051]|nr:hypothetical protein K438DRAFT_1783875 [Mycena galopus ATCC 62051]
MSISSFQPTRVLCGDLYPMAPSKITSVLPASVTRRAGRASEPLTIPHAQRVALRAAESRGGRRAYERRRTTRGGPLPLADPYPARTTLTLLLRAETASPARQHCRVHTSTPPVRVPAGDHFEIRGASSTSEPMLGNAGAAPAPSLQMLMAHHGAGKRGGSQGRGRDGADGLTAVGGQHDEVAVRWIWGGEVDGRGQGAASLQTWRNPYPPHPRRTESAAAAASQDPHELGAKMKHHPRLSVFGSGSRAGADTCADAGTGISASSTARGSSSRDDQKQNGFGRIVRAWQDTRLQRKDKECEQVGEAEDENLIQAVWHVDSGGRQEIREGIGTKPSQSQGANAKAKANNIEVLAEVDIEGEAMEEEVDSEGAEDGERVIEPEPEAARWCRRENEDRENGGENGTIYVMLMASPNLGIPKLSGVNLYVNVRLGLQPVLEWLVNCSISRDGLVEDGPARARRAGLQGSERRGPHLPHIQATITADHKYFPDLARSTRARAMRYYRIGFVFCVLLD